MEEPKVVRTFSVRIVGSFHKHPFQKWLMNKVDKLRPVLDLGYVPKMERHSKAEEQVVHRPAVRLPLCLSCRLSSGPAQALMQRARREGLTVVLQVPSGASAASDG